MKIATKIILGAWLIMALCFSIGGTYMIQKNFQVSYDNMVETRKLQHISNRYALESNVRSSAEKEDNYSVKLVEKCEKKIEEYGLKDTGVILAEIGERAESEIFYKNFEEIDNALQNYIETSGVVHYEVYEKGNKHYLVIASLIDFYPNHPKIKIVNRYDVSKTFQERDRQMEEFRKIVIFGMLISFVLLFVMAHLITIRIGKLSKTTKQIAKGEYDLRTGMKNEDEIGDLSRNFDRMAEAIEQHIVQLKKEVEAREQFVTDFSHELKTPMTSVMGYSQMLLGNNLKEEQRQKAVGYIYQECKRLQKLSNELLKMLGILEEQLEIREVQTEWIAEQLENIYMDEMEHARLSIQLEQATIATDVELLITLLKNLIHNGDGACKNKEEDFVQVYGRVNLEQDCYEVQVVDSGCGMEPEEIEKIFQPFYRIDKSRSGRQGRSGVGLSICRNICQVLHITMSIESKPGEGTKVTLILIPPESDEVREGDEE